MLMAPAAEFRRLRAPQQDGQKLVDPPLAVLPDTIAKNRAQLATIRFDMQGRSLADLMATARQGLLRAACNYTSQYRAVPQLVGGINRASSLADVPFALSGHQPQLFHAGVWYKNFVLGDLARKVAGVGIHLVIDSDLCRGASIRVPTGSVELPRVEGVEYDAPAPEMPHEERRVRDEALFRDFPNRVVSLLKPFVPLPLVETLWKLIDQRCRDEANLGLRLAQGRHALEETWGNETLELPQSAVCQLPEFAWFVAHVLAQLPRFWSAHNQVLAEYRHAHHLRNRAHPVPDLIESDGWLEAPFWVWRGDDPRRRPLLARCRDDGLELTDRHSLLATLSLSDDLDAGTAVDQLLDLARRGIKIRTRALTTTLFARLVLSDVFLHGIGGAKYDQVTDLIASRFYGFPLPEFAAVSATLRLPIEDRHAEAGRAPAIEAQLRAMKYHPERFVEANGDSHNQAQSRIAQLMETKRRWIATRKTPENAHERHHAIRKANESLGELLAPLRQRLEVSAAEHAVQRRASMLLESREYSFCLFPRRHLERLLLDGAPQATYS